MARPEFPSIPMPTEDLHQLYVVALTLKQVVEVITLPGPGRKPTMHTGQQPPTNAIEGDFWLATATTTTTLNVYVGGRWLTVGTLT